MKNFSIWLESRIIGNQSKSNMKLVGDVLKGAVEVGADAAADYFGIGLAKNIFNAALKQRKNFAKKIQDDEIIKKSKDIIKTRISQKAQNRPGNIESIVNSYFDVTDESQSLLSDQERQLVINSILDAVNSNSIKSGFAQQLVNGILQEKINAIQNILNISIPKKIVI
jgi:hypothetical protein